MATGCELLISIYYQDERVRDIFVEVWQYSTTLFGVEGRWDWQLRHIPESKFKGLHWAALKT
jgi:hypothetical protein